MPTLTAIAAFLLSQWPTISSFVGATLTGLVTKNWSAFLGVLITALTAFSGAPKAAAFSAHLKRRGS